MKDALFRLTEQIMFELLGAEVRRLNVWKDKLIEKNKQYFPGTVGFIWDGQRYTQSNVMGQLPRFPSLHPDLWNEANLLTKDLKLLSQEQAFVRQALVTVLADCRSEQDIRDALPDCIAEIIEPLRSLPRTREEAFTLKDKPRQLKQWLKTRPNIDVYASARLIF